MRRLSLLSSDCSNRQSQLPATPAQAKYSSAPRTCSRSLWLRPARFSIQVCSTAILAVGPAGILPADHSRSRAAGLEMTLLLIQHGRGEFQCFITLSPEHARDLLAPRLAAYLAQLSKGATASYFFRHHELGCRRRRHRRQMGNTKHLMALRQLTHARADGVGDFTTDVRVNLVKD